MAPDVGTRLFRHQRVAHVGPLARAGGAGGADADDRRDHGAPQEDHRASLDAIGGGHAEPAAGAGRHGRVVRPLGGAGRAASTRRRVLRDRHGPRPARPGGPRARPIRRSPRQRAAARVPALPALPQLQAVHARGLRAVHGQHRTRDLRLFDVVRPEPTIRDHAERRSRRNRRTHGRLRVQPTRTGRDGRHDDRVAQPGRRAAHRYRGRRSRLQHRHPGARRKLPLHGSAGRRVQLLLRAARLGRRRWYGGESYGGRRRSANRCGGRPTTTTRAHRCDACPDTRPDAPVADSSQPQPRGLAIWRDDTLRSDAVFISVDNLPAGQEYSVWLSGGDGTLSIGPLGAGARTR